MKGKGYGIVALIAIALLLLLVQQVREDKLKEAQEVSVIGRAMSIEDVYMLKDFEFLIDSIGLDQIVDVISKKGFRKGNTVCYKDIGYGHLLCLEKLESGLPYVYTEVRIRTPDFYRYTIFRDRVVLRSAAVQKDARWQEIQKVLERLKE